MSTLGLFRRIIVDITLLVDPRRGMEPCDGFSNNFPRLESSGTPDFPSLFPWGCD